MDRLGTTVCILCIWICTSLQQSNRNDFYESTPRQIMHLRVCTLLLLHTHSTPLQKAHATEWSLEKLSDRYSEKTSTIISCCEWYAGEARGSLL